MSTQDFSVITLNSQRNDHLRNLIRGIEKSTLKPKELIVVYMNQTNELQVQTSFSIKPFHITTDHLPLAEARNKGAEESSSDTLIFLDVDCIPSSTMFANILTNEALGNSLLMATPRYLKSKIDQQPFNDRSLEDSSILHNSRKHLRAGITQDYTSFWSLCFALTKDTFNTIGGFDSKYFGYGGEDTDFALSAQLNVIPFQISDAVCFHQRHDVYKPPLQHLQDIITNSSYFYSKWQHWPMSGWLKDFVRLGYIEWDENSNKPIKIKRIPTADELLLYKDSKSAY